MLSFDAIWWWGTLIAGRLAGVKCLKCLMCIAVLVMLSTCCVCLMT